MVTSYFGSGSMLSRVLSASLNPNALRIPMVIIAV